MKMTGRNITRTLLVIAAISAFTLALVIAAVNPGAKEDSVVAGTNTAPSEVGFGNTGIFAKFTANGDDIIGSNSRTEMGDVDLSDYTELIWASFSASGPTTAGVRSVGVVYDPFTIVKSIDKATPLLLQALAENQTVEVEILVFGSAPGTGVDQLELKYTLLGARIDSQRITSATNTSNSAGEFSNTETIGINYATIQVEHDAGGTAFQVNTLESGS